MPLPLPEGRLEEIPDPFPEERFDEVPDPLPEGRFVEIPLPLEGAGLDSLRDGVGAGGLELGAGLGAGRLDTTGLGVGLTATEVRSSDLDPPLPLPRLATYVGPLGWKTGVGAAT